MSITIILCTYNRCESLRTTLDSLASSVLPQSVEWEVLVVDNNSNDQTRSVAAEYCQRYPGRFRYLFEPRQGKSHALNMGIRAAHGDVLAFVDDDVTVEEAWLGRLTAPLECGEWAGTGGRILPNRPPSLPPWLAFDGPLGMGARIVAQFDRGDEPYELDEAPYGTNMAFRKEMFAKYGLFRTDLGPRPDSEIRNEDTEFGRRLLAAGERLLYTPSAIVYHEVPEHRITKKYLLKRWFDDGRAEIRERKTKPKIWGIPRRYFRVANYTLRFLPKKMVHWLRARDPQERFRLKCIVWYAAGEIVEMWHQPSPANDGSNAVDAHGMLD